MRSIIKMIFAIISSLIIIGAVPVESKLNLQSFENIELELMENTDFIQNGIRVEYSVNQSIRNEFLRIKGIFKEKFGSNIQFEKNIISYSDFSKEIKAIIWNDKGNTKVQITYINNNNSNNNSFIRDELVDIQNVSAKNIKYFNFIKVKIIGDKKQNVLEVLKKNINGETLETLDIYNGSVSKAKLYDDNKVNMGFVKYDTGEYLIVGTPVIFVTY